MKNLHDIHDDVLFRNMWRTIDDQDAYDELVEQHYQNIACDADLLDEAVGESSAEDMEKFKTAQFEVYRAAGSGGADDMRTAGIALAEVLYTMAKAYAKKKADIGIL